MEFTIPKGRRIQGMYIATVTEVYNLLLPCSSHVAVCFAIQGTNIDEECWTRMNTLQTQAAMIKSSGDRNDWNHFFSSGLLEQ